MSVTSCSLVKTLIPSGGSLDKLVSSLTTFLMICGWRFSTFELDWNPRERTKNQWIQKAMIGKLKQHYLPMPFAGVFVEPESKRSNNCKRQIRFREANAKRCLRFWFVILSTNQITDGSTVRSWFYKTRWHRSQNHTPEVTAGDITAFGKKLRYIPSRN